MTSRGSATSPTRRSTPLRVLAANGPVVIVALPATPQIDPVTGADHACQTFALQSSDRRQRVDPVRHHRWSWTPGTVLKLQNASLFVQNQGSALQALGDQRQRPGHLHLVQRQLGRRRRQRATRTPRPAGGDWGGIVFRNYDEAADSRRRSRSTARC